MINRRAPATSTELIETSTILSPAFDSTDMQSCSQHVPRLCIGKRCTFRVVPSRLQFFCPGESYGAMRRSVFRILRIAYARCTVCIAPAMWTQASSKKRCLPSIAGPCRNNSSTRSSLVVVQEVWPLCLIGLDSWSATA